MRDDLMVQQQVKNKWQHMVGVISEDPSVVLNSPEVGPPVGLAGRVKVNLIPGQDLIKCGDLLFKKYWVYTYILDL